MNSSSAAVSAIDSRIFRSLFGTDEIRDVFSDSTYLSHCITTEIALARAQSTVGIIPSTTGATLTNSLSHLVTSPILPSTAKSENLKSEAPQLDVAKLSRETEIVGYPILPLVTQLVSIASQDAETKEAAKYIHWGATTQDIMDTASILQIKAGLEIVERLLNSTCSALAKLAEKYRDTPMAGRTHLQHALPVTFGYKAAVWLDSLQRHQERLSELKKRALMVQYGGAAGTLASLGSTSVGLDVRRELAKELNLENPNITWHVSRDSIAETTNLLALIGGSLGKIAYDLIIMSSNEFSEVSEPFVPHRGASSTMPQKRNPISSEVILAASKILRSNAGLVLDGMVSDFERASGPWHLEWVAVPESFVICVGALHQADFALSGLVVHEAKMKENLYSTKGLIVGEAVMMGLAPHLGRGKAHDVVYEACKVAIENDRSLVDVLLENVSVVESLGEEELRRLCDPVNYMGAATLMVDEVLGRT
ncbi:3-carboxy-cis,cis-muconate cycloisomerase [Halenospora varia]|nr:3-carboxy-cis,cis-muconate cycloisomerase [Halenospora varia]